MKHKIKIGATEKSALRSVFIKPISMVLSLLYTPALLAYLGDEKYGVWATILSVISWVNYCDIGIGNGLRNILTVSLTEKNYERAKRTVSTAYICLTGISLFVLAILLISVKLVNWNTLFKTDIDINITLLISFVFICVNFVLALCNTLLYALQKSELVSLQSVFVQLINIISVYVLQRISSGNLVLLAITFGSSSLLVYMSTTFNLLRNKKYLRPSFKCFDKKMVKDINQLGLKFFIAQIAFVVLYTTDNIIVSKYFGAAQVTPFSLVDKVFNIGYSVFAAFLIPYWSKTTAELASHNFDGIRKYFRNLNILALFFSCGCIAVAFIFRPVVNVWLGKTIEFSNELIGVMCIYYCIYSFCGVSSPIINGLGAVNGVMLLGIFQGIVNIPLSIYLATDGGLGIVGVRFATLILVSIGAVYQFIYFYYTLNKLEKKETLRSGGLHE